jgi:hypothetical protein
MQAHVSSTVVSWVVIRMVIACPITLNLFIFAITGSSIEILANFTHNYSSAIINGSHFVNENQTDKYNLHEFLLKPYYSLLILL